MESITNLLAFICIGVACIAQSVAQSCPYIDTACTCVSLSVQCRGLREIPPLRTGANVTRVASAYFVEGNITSVPKDRLPPGLEYLVFNDQPLTQIDDNALDTSANSLYYIEVMQAKLTSLPRAFLKLTNLNFLYLIDTPIQTWDTAVLQNIGHKLTELYLINVGITGYPDWLSNFSVLKALTLSKNNLTTIPHNFSSPFKDTLTELTLANTGLTAVPEGVSSLANLTNLDLSGNNFNNSEIDKLLTIPVILKLSTLSLNSVGLNHILNFSNLKNLVTINLDNNNISDHTEGSLPPSVAALSLSRNNLPSVPTLIQDLTKLQRLDLSYNEITTIPNSTFAKLAQLNRLFLNNNPIKTISAAGFSGLVSVNYLYLGNTNLSEIPVALGDLTNASLQIDIRDIPSLSCPCLRSPHLDTWFSNHSVIIYITGDCSNGQSVSSYFVTGCVTPSASPTTMPTSTTPGGHAPVLQMSLLCRYGSLLLLLSPLSFSF